MDATDPITTALTEFPAPTADEFVTKLGRNTDDDLVVHIVWRRDTDSWSFAQKHLVTIKRTRTEALEFIPEGAYPGEYDIEAYSID